MGAGEDTARGQRLDKWLWHGRLVKTRSLAGRLVAGGKVRVNREKVIKPSTMVQAGDVITAALAGRVHVVRVLAFAERRGPPAQARELYRDLLAGKDPVVDAASPDAVEPRGKTRE
jgi:ribosome-associated heat shock protein Hsp15